jgi:membrane glycosyltransferase
MISPSLAAWMSPTILGFVLAIPLSWGSGLLAAGLALRRIGILNTPEEAEPPPIVPRANALTEELDRHGFDDADGILAVHADPALRAAHEAMLPPSAARRRGDIDPQHAVAIAKLTDAASIADAAQWLDPRERMVVLHDRALLSIMASLPPPPAAAAAE